MIAVIYELLLLLTGSIAGAVGALSGLGGGVVLVPILTLLFGVPIEYAAGTSLLATIATSSSAGSAFVKEKLTNIRIGMSLEIATTIGAITGALVAAIIYAHNLPNLIFIAFGAVLFLSVIPSAEGLFRGRFKQSKPDGTTKRFQLHGRYYDRASKRTIVYNGVRWYLGEAVMFFAGIVSGLLGIGSGALKVIGMDWGMKLPIKVSTATSDFMIGVTAAASTAIYLALGFIQPVSAAPVVIGVLIGSFAGAKIMDITRSNRIRLFFIIVLGLVALEMLLRGLGVI